MFPAFQSWFELIPHRESRRRFFWIMEDTWLRYKSQFEDYAISFEVLFQELFPQVAKTRNFGHASTWYLSPIQHVAEVVFLMPPVVYLTLACIRKIKKDLPANLSYKPSYVEKIWGLSLLVIFFLQGYFKVFCGRLDNHPAFILQPCHITCITLGLAPFVCSPSMYLVILHIFSTLTWVIFFSVNLFLCIS